MASSDHSSEKRNSPASALARELPGPVGEPERVALVVERFRDLLSGRGRRIQDIVERIPFCHPDVVQSAAFAGERARGEASETIAGFAFKAAFLDGRNASHLAK